MNYPGISNNIYSYFSWYIVLKTHSWNPCLLLLYNNNIDIWYNREGEIHTSEVQTIE